MNHSKMSVYAGIVTVMILAAGYAAAETYPAPLTVAPSPDGAGLYVCARAASQILVVDTATQAVTGTFDTPVPPSGIAVHPDGAPLFVTGDAPDGSVYAFDVDGTLLYEIAVGHSPIAPVLCPDAALLFVCNRFDDTVSFIDLGTQEIVAEVAVAREPVAAGITPDGERLFVANHLPLGPADGDFIAAEISVVDVASQAVVGSVLLPNGSSSLRGLCVSPDGAHVYVTHILSRYQLPTTQLERGWMNTNALSILDARTGEFVNTVLLDDVSRGASNPWGVTCTDNGRHICVAHAGTHEISVIDRARLHMRLRRVEAGEQVTSVSRTSSDVPNDLSFLVGIRDRIALHGNGPRGIAAVGDTVYAAEFFSDSLGVVDVAAAIPRAQQVPLADDVAMPIVRLGKKYFNDADLCFQQWQSCASCHPDARVDGLNWDLLNDGIGNPKNTKSMLLSHETPPVMSLGVRADAETAVRAGIKFIQFAVRPEEDAVAIDEYLKALAPVPSPELVGGELSEAARRGEAVFKQAGCAECHPAPLYTNLKAYDLGLGTGMDAGKDFDTPTLVEVWRTAPYLHDGRAATLHDVFTDHNPDDKHGQTSTLTEQELDDLVAFMRSL